MYLVVDSLKQILAAAPEPLLSADRFGSRTPDSSAVLPSVVVSMALADTDAAGVGRVFYENSRRRPSLMIRLAGTVELELWVGNAETLETLSRQIQARLQRAPERLREHGFLRCRPRALDAAVLTRHTPTTGSPFPFWRQRLAYDFVFEGAEIPLETEGGPIQQVDVEMDKGLKESLAVPQG